MKRRQHVYYDHRGDVLYILVRQGFEQEIEEVIPGVNIELDKRGRLLGIEILNASRSLRQLMKKSPVDATHRESLRETAKILAIPGARASIEEGMRELKQGRGIPLGQVLASQ